MSGCRNDVSRLFQIIGPYKAISGTSPKHHVTSILSTHGKYVVVLMGMDVNCDVIDRCTKLAACLLADTLCPHCEVVNEQMLLAWEKMMSPLTINTLYCLPCPPDC